MTQSPREARSFDETELAIARVYAGAILELAEDQGVADSLDRELEELEDLLRDQPRLAAFLASPVVDADERREALESMFRGRLSDLAVDSLQVMNRKGRIGLVPAVAHVYRHLLNERHGRVEVQVTTAVPLREEQREHLRRAVAEKLDKEPLLEEAVDEDLIGGVVFRIGDRKIDGSVATHLKSLSEALLARGSRESAHQFVQSEGS